MRPGDRRGAAARGRGGRVREAPRVHCRDGADDPEMCALSSPLLFSPLIARIIHVCRFMSVSVST